jgi:uncharacterized small protein (DUF1192 family)
MSDEEYIPDRLRVLGYPGHADEVERLIAEIARVRTERDNWKFLAEKNWELVAGLRTKIIMNADVTERLNAEIARLQAEAKCDARAQGDYVLEIQKLRAR